MNETELHGVPHRDGDGPTTPPRYLGLHKVSANFTIPINISSVKYALKSVLGLGDTWVPHGDGSHLDGWRGS